MLKIGITGVNGFVGSSLYTYLKKQNYDVVGFSRRKDDSRYTYWDISKGPYKTDISLHIIIHCAGTVDDWAPYEECYANNCVGTKNVLDSFPHLQKFIYISSCSVYDPKDITVSIDESSLCGNFLNGYSRSKYETEQIIVHHSSPSQKIIIRPHVIYGEGDTKIIPRLLRAHRFNRFIVLGDGTNSLSVTHIDNLCQAVEKSTGLSSTHTKEIFIVTDKEPVTVRHLVGHVQKKFGIHAKNLYVNKKIASYIGVVFETLYRIVGSKTPPLISSYVVHQMTSHHNLSIRKAQIMLKYTPTKSYLDL